MKTIPLGGRVAAGRVALVDDEDYDLVMQYKWCAVVYKARAVTYAMANVRPPGGPKTTIMMHNLIMGAAGIDHVNHNGLDNLRRNLRIADDTQNQGNKRSLPGSTSQYKGVSWAGGRKQRWVAQIRRDNIKHHLGYFKDEADAARAYDAAARDMFGEYAALNFPEPGEVSAHGAGNLDATAGTPPEEGPPGRGAASRYAGVKPEGGRWHARIYAGRKCRSLGGYASEIEAALAYDTAVREAGRNTAALNFPDGLTPELAEQMRAQQEAGKVKPRICEVCGDEYVPQHNRPTKYCGKKCAWLGYVRKHEEEERRETEGRLF